MSTEPPLIQHICEWLCSSDLTRPALFLSTSIYHQWSSVCVLLYCFWVSKLYHTTLYFIFLLKWVSLYNKNLQIQLEMEKTTCCSHTKYVLEWTWPPVVAVNKNPCCCINERWIIEMDPLQWHKSLTLQIEPNLMTPLKTAGSTILVDKGHNRYIFRLVFNQYERSSHWWIDCSWFEKATARLLTRMRKGDRITQISASLQWLPIWYRIDFKVLLIFLKNVTGLAPSHLSDLVILHQPVHLANELLLQAPQS